MPANCILKFFCKAYLFGQVIIGCKSAYETIIDQTYLLSIECKLWRNEIKA